MNTRGFTLLLEQLDDKVWQALIDGQDLLLVNDQYLEPGGPKSANAIISASASDSDYKILRQNSIAEAETILANYYLTHPLTLPGFNQQVKNLFQQHGMRAFAAPLGEFPERTLFVEGGEVVAENRDSPRHRYGAFFELQQPLQDEARDKAIMKWLESGDAHERYLEMNVCRYNC